jgi:hypothetical protein
VTTILKKVYTIAGKLEKYDEKLVRDVISQTNLRVPEGYIKFIVLWYSNKFVGKNESASVEEKKPVVGDVQKIIKIMENIINSVWNIGVSMTKNGELKGLKGFNTIDPPNFENRKLEGGLMGFYQNSSHKLVIDIEKQLSLKKISPDVVVSTFEEYKKKYSENTLYANFFFRSDPSINAITSLKIPAVTLVHELLHAFQRLDHTEGAHQPVDFTIGETDISADFDNAAVHIFGILMEKYTPTYVL